MQERWGMQIIRLLQHCSSGLCLTEDGSRSLEALVGSLDTSISVEAQTQAEGNLMHIGGLGLPGKLCCVYRALPSNFGTTLVFDTPPAIEHYFKLTLMLPSPQQSALSALQASSAR